VGPGRVDARGVGGGVDAAPLTAITRLGDNGIEVLARPRSVLKMARSRSSTPMILAPWARARVSLGFGVDLEERVEPGGLGGGVEGGDFFVGEGADDDEDRAGAGSAGLEDWIG